MADLSDKLRGIFLGELDDQLIVMNADLIALESDPGNAERLKSLFRVAHTLKGAARATGVEDIADTCHTLETMLANARDRGLTLDASHFRILFAAADSLAEAGRRLRGDKGAPKPENRPEAEQQAPDYLRIDPATLDAVLASVEQLLVAIDSVGVHARDARMLSEITAASRASAGRVDRRTRRNGSQPAPKPADPRAIDPEDQWRRVSELSSRLASNAAADARYLGNAGGELAERTRRLRMRPFGDACEALPRVVRDLATGLGKDVRLQIIGGDVHADRVVLDGLREALVHLVRNAIDHGVESASARAAAGKPAQATVTIAASISGDSICVTVEDDGAGLDLAAIRSSFKRLGKSAPADDDALVAALFAGGVSTRAEATTISGRGVGLDLVRNLVERIHGTINVTWTKGKATRFTIQSPLTLATIRALLVKVGTETVALPTAHVERVKRVSAADLRRAEGSDLLLGAADKDDRPIRIVSLARLLGPPLAERVLDQHASAVVLEAQGRRLAVVVDELIAEQVVIVRKLDGARASLPHLSGVAILGGGRIALVANVPRILSNGLDAVSSATLAAPAADEAPLRRRILVVDDSVTTRMLEQSVLEAAGYEVKTAVDGMDAWEQLAQDEWDLVVSDVEMPRMDGFGLCAAIRASPRLSRLPVVLVTALEKQEHRAKGLEAGADAYLGKSSFDQRSLLETIQQLLG